MTTINTSIVREPDGSLSVEVNGRPVEGVASLQINGTGSVVIVMSTANVTFETRREATNVVPIRPR
jgi:hypothetical protein